MEKVDFIIGESSWDIECFAKIYGYTPKYFIHNDYFSSSNIYNTKILNRLATFFSVLYLAIVNFLLCKRVLFSSLNSEVMLVARLFSGNKMFGLFIPNFVVRPAVGSLLEKLLNNFKGRIFVSDSLTKAALESYLPIMSDCAFSLKAPERGKMSEVHFIVSLPAAYSHKETEKIADVLYGETLSIGRRLSKNGVEVYYLPHPRDEKILLPLDCRVIKPHQISSLGDEICYISIVSSLSLNKRYGGKYGVWIRSDSLNMSTNTRELYQRYSVELQDFLDEL